MIQGKRIHADIFCEDSMDGLPQLADSFAVNKSDIEYAAFLTSPEVLRHQILYVPWAKRMEVQDTVDGNLNWLVHTRRIASR